MWPRACDLKLGVSLTKKKKLHHNLVSFKNFLIFHKRYKDPKREWCKSEYHPICEVQHTITFGPRVILWRPEMLPQKLKKQVSTFLERLTQQRSNLESTGNPTLHVPVRVISLNISFLALVQSVFYFFLPSKICSPGYDSDLWYVRFSLSQDEIGLCSTDRVQ